MYKVSSPGRGGARKGSGRPRGATKERQTARVKALAVKALEDAATALANAAHSTGLGSYLAAARKVNGIASTFRTRALADRAGLDRVAPAGGEDALS